MSERTVVDQLIDLALEEDIGPGDRTTEWTVDEGTSGRAVIVAKAECVVAGVAVAFETFRRVEADLQVKPLVRDGDALGVGDTLLELEGPLSGILKGERVALNFLTRLSGVATLTRKFVEAVSGTSTRILDTRKTTPGWRMLEKGAVLAGGGANHRVGLYDMVLVKDNHIVGAGGITPAVKRVQAMNNLGLLVEVEVTTLEELRELLPLGVDRVLLDNMELATMEEAVGMIHAMGPQRPMAEASGNMNLATVAPVAETGVDFISVGALTHSAPGADLSLRILDRWTGAPAS